MLRRLTLALALMLAIAALAGCGTTSVNTSPTTPPADGSATSGGQAATQKAGIGDTLAIKGNDAQLAVTLTKTKRMPAEKAYGVQIHPALYGVQLTIKNTGTKVYDDSITNGAALVDSKDQTVNPEFAVSDKNGNMLAGQLDSVKIAPGDKRSGWVFFAMKASQKPRVLQFTAESGFGPEVGEWTLN